MAVELLALPLVLLYILVGLAAYWYLTARPKNVPPGPLGLPYLGYAPFLSGAPWIDLAKLGKKYKSNIVSLHMGPLFAVSLNDVDAVRAAFVDQETIFNGRPKEQFVTDYIATGKDGKIHSVIALEGPKANSLIEFINGGFKEMGVNTPKMEGPILEEISHLIAAIQEENGHPFDYAELSKPTNSSMLARTVFGYRWSPRSEEYTEFMDGAAEAYQLLAGSPIQVMPWLRHIPGPLQAMWKKTEACMKRHHDFLREAVKRHEETYQNGVVRDFADMYVRHMKGGGPLDRATFQDEDDFVGTATTAFQAGGESTNATLSWALLFLLHNPDVQKKVHEEIDSNIAAGKHILFSDKESLPYTAGAIYEALRLGGNSTFGVPHSNTEEAQLLGYRIPKRSFVLLNIWACHRDPKQWKYPEEFKPENWIDEKGRFYVPDGFLSFSTGPRKCPGRDMAQMMAFMLFANLLQRYVFVNPEGQVLPGTDEYVPGISARPKPFKVQAIPRLPLVKDLPA